MSLLIAVALILSPQTHASCANAAKGQGFAAELPALYEIKRQLDHGQIDGFNRYFRKNQRAYEFGEGRINGMPAIDNQNTGLVGASSNQVFRVRADDGTVRFIKTGSHPDFLLPRLENFPIDEAQRAMSRLIGAALVEEQGGVRLLGFGLHPVAGRHALIMEMESAFGDEPQVNIKDFGQTGLDPLHVWRRTGWHSGESPAERFADMMMNAFDAGISPADPQAMMNAKGELRWIDGDHWKSTRRMTQHDLMERFAWSLTDSLGIFRNSPLDGRRYVRHLVRRMPRALLERTLLNFDLRVVAPGAGHIPYQERETVFEVLRGIGLVTTRDHATDEITRLAH